jgi:SAM-dependent methyltransferase
MPLNTDDWDSHWASYADSAQDNPAQRYRRHLVLQNLAITGDDRVLDIGSGSGDLIGDLLSVHPTAQYLGLELSDTGVEISGRKVPDATFLQRDLLAPGAVPPAFAGWATHAVCSEVLEHVDEPGVLLQNALPYVKPGGRVVITVPGGPMSAFDRAIGHRRHYTRHDLEQLLLGEGLQVERVWGAGFPFFNLYRFVVIARGRKLVADVARSEEGAATTGLARLVMTVFGRLFRFNRDRSRFGYQLVAVCRAP